MIVHVRVRRCGLKTARFPMRMGGAQGPMRLACPPITGCVQRRHQCSSQQETAGATGFNHQSPSWSRVRVVMDVGVLMTRKKIPLRSSQDNETERTEIVHNKTGTQKDQS